MLPESASRPALNYALIALGCMVAAILVVALVSAAIAHGGPFAFDRWLLLALRTPGDTSLPAGPPWLAETMLDVTALGGKSLLTVVVVGTVSFLLACRHRLTAALVVGGTISGSLAVQIGKDLVGRERPALVDHLVEVGSASFPSAHAANSAIVYLTLALLTMQIVPRPLARQVLLGAAITLVLLIGASRVYLGVHWPSDVAAGWAAGTLWALAWWSLGSWLRHRRA